MTSGDDHRGVQVNVPLLLELRKAPAEASSERQEFIPLSEGPAELQSMESQTVGHD